MLHIDGKHKLHHGKWILVTIGPHDLKFCKEENKIVHSYRPCVYMFCKQQETRESVRMLCDATDFLARSRFGVGLKPGTVNMDHSCGFRQGVLDVWPDAGILTCWPHLKRKVGQGEYLSTTHDFYETLTMILDAVHMSQSEDMQDLLLQAGGKLIDPKMAHNPKLRTLWNEYAVYPWACWSIGLYPETPLNIANNQPIEAWHKGVMKTLRRALKGSTAAVLEHSFPTIVHKDSKHLSAYRTVSSFLTMYRIHICPYHNSI